MLMGSQKKKNTENWKDAQIEKNRIELIAVTENSQGGHIARRRDYKKFTLKRETALTPKVVEGIIRL